MLRVTGPPGGSPSTDWHKREDNGAAFPGEASRFPMATNSKVKRRGRSPTSLDRPRAGRVRGTRPARGDLRLSPLDALPEQIAILDEEGEILAVNSAWSRFPETSALIGPRSGVGFNLTEACESASGLDSPEAGALARGLRDLQAGLRTRYRLEYPLHGPEGRRWFAVRSLRFEEEEGFKIVVIHEEVTEMRAGEAALYRGAEELLEAQKAEVVGRLAGGIAHDFNNLLMVILSHSEILTGRLDDDDPLRRNAHEIVKASHRGMELTRQLLSFSRKKEIHVQDLDLNAIVLSLERLIGMLIGESRELVIVSGPALAPIKADAGQIQQVLLNLAVNARDAMPHGGKLVIETENVEAASERSPRERDLGPGRHVLLTVSDTGVGIDEETRSHIFEPFFTTRKDGTGLGLATVRGIVKQSRAKILVDGEPGRGARFRIYFPAAEEAAASPEPRPRFDARREGRGTVLVMEHEEAVRSLIREILEGWGAVVLEARTGEEALALCRNHPGSIDLLIADVVMPQMSGREVADLAAPLRPEMRLLFVSGYPQADVARYGVADSGNGFLQKPFMAAELTERVRWLLDEGRGGGRM